MSQPFTRRERERTPFYDPQGILFHWDEGGGGWNLQQAQAHCAIIGPSGCGKTSGGGDTILKALFRSSPTIPGGSGGIFLIAKPGEADRVEGILRRNGRGEDIIRITPGGRYKIPWLEFLSSRFGDTPAAPVSVFEEVASANGGTGSEKGGGENAFFEEAFHGKLMNLVHVIQLAGLPVTVQLMEDIASSQPQTIAQGKDPEWRRNSICWHVLREAEAKTRNNPATWEDYKVCYKHFMLKYCMLSDKTRGVVELMFDSLSRAFLTTPLRGIFCEPASGPGETNVWPEQTFDEGKIIILDIPVQVHHKNGVLAALCLKRIFQLAVMKRHGPPGSLRPAVLFCDEAATFFSPLDADYQAVARASGGISIFLFQTISNVRQTLGSDERATALLNNLSTKIFCNCFDETARYAQQLFGERLVRESTMNTNRNTPVDSAGQGGGGTGGGISRSWQRRHFVEAFELQQLRRGGAAANYRVDTIIHVGGTVFPGEDGEMVPFKKLAFKQEK